jgi:flagella basal body P-ring formation protein FlgA
MRLFTFLMCTTYAYAGCVEVNSDRIYTRDLARAFVAFQAIDPDLPVAYAPSPGVRRTFSIRDSLAIAKHYGLEVDPRELHDFCFERETRTMDRDEFVKAIADALSQMDVETEVLDYSRYRVPYGHLEFTRDGLTVPAVDQPETPIIWRGKLIYGGGRSVAVWATVRLAVLASVVVAKIALRRGEPIGPEQIEIAQRKIAPFAKGVLSELGQVVGKVTRRLIPAGQLVFENLLEAQPDVREGDLVSVEVMAGEANLRFLARAQTVGYKGGTVLVQNPMNGKSFRATVLSHGIVAVQASQVGG